MKSETLYRITDLAALPGLNPAMVLDLQRVTARQNGVFLVAGEAGSGRTTTLHALSAGHSVVPVDLLFDTVGAGADNAAGALLAKVSAFLEHGHPDLIVFGELDSDKIATGALMFARNVLTLGIVTAPSAGNALERWFNFNPGRGRLLEYIVGVLAQRLVGLVCPHCSHKEAPGPACATLGLDPREFAGLDEIVVSHHADGCAHCLHGFVGRTGVFELIAIESSGDRAKLYSGTIDRTVASSARELLRGPSMAAGALDLVRAAKISLAEYDWIARPLPGALADLKVFLRAEHVRFNENIAAWRALSQENQRDLWLLWAAWHLGEREPDRWNAVEPCLESLEAKFPAVGKNWRDVLCLPRPEAFPLIFTPGARDLWSNNPFDPLLQEHERHAALRVLNP